jgi:hypothetical protein
MFAQRVVEDSNIVPMRVRGIPSRTARLSHLLWLADAAQRQNDRGWAVSVIERIYGDIDSHVAL